MKRFATSLTAPFSVTPLGALIIVGVRRKLFPQAVKASLSLQAPLLTDALYGLLIKSGTPLNPFLSASLISHSSQFFAEEFFPRATQLLRDTNRPDIVVFNSAVSGLARLGLSEPVFELYQQLRQLGLSPDEYTLSSLIKGCDSVNRNEIAHAASIRFGLVRSVFLVSGLVENYSKLGCLGNAEKCYEECLVPDSVVSTAMINGYICNHEFEKGKAVFTEMRVLGLSLNEFTLTSVLGGVFEVNEGEQIQGFCIKTGLLYRSSNHLNNAIMSMYSRCGSNFDAVKVFDEISSPDVVSWTERIGVSDSAAEAMEIFKFCISEDLEINEVTMINVLSALEGSDMFKYGQQIHAVCYKQRFFWQVSVSNAMIYVYGKTGALDDARRVFDKTSFKDSVSWNSLISAYSDYGLVDQAISALSQMCHSGSVPDRYTLASILDIVSSSNALELAKQIHSLLIRLGFMSDNSILSYLVTAYGKCSRIDFAERIFKEISNVGVVHVNAMLDAFLCNNSHGLFGLFQSRWNSSLEVDVVTYTMVLKACGVTTDLEQGRIIHSLVVKSGNDADNFVRSAVIDLYCKCGSLIDAEHAFENAAINNQATWNAMMMGYAQHACYAEVCKLFSRMTICGMKPDEITYLAVLTSCCHSGLLDEAQYHLNSMFEVHGVEPCLEHYACIVDLSGRAGLVEDAKRTIDQMPICPDAHIWQILLFACSIHGNLEIGKVAAEKLFDMQFDSDSTYVLLANLYSSAGLWKVVGELRREMKEKALNKEAGCSWIQVKGSIHYFFAGNTSHAMSKEAYEMLHCLRGEMMEMKNEECWDDYY